MSKKAFFFLSCSLLLCSCSDKFNQRSLAATVERSMYLMGTQLEISVDAPTRETGLKVSDQVFETVSALEKRISTWIPSSELSKLNALPSSSFGRIALSPELERDLEAVDHLAQFTQFAFNPYLGPLVQAWGLRTGGSIPSKQMLNRALKKSSPESFTWIGSSLYKKISGAAFEEGGFGKGLALDYAAETLKRNGIKKASFNFGGQLYFWGEGSRKVEIASPADRSQTLLSFEMGPGSIATSSNSEHGLTLGQGKNSKRIGHLLDGKTGNPVSFNGSLTVESEQGLSADALTKLLTLSPMRALEFANQHHVKLLFVLPSRKNSEWEILTSQAWNRPLQLKANCHLKNTPYVHSTLKPRESSS